MEVSGRTFPFNFHLLQPLATHSHALCKELLTVPPFLAALFYTSYIIPYRLLSVNSFPLENQNLLVQVKMAVQALLVEGQNLVESLLHIVNLTLVIF